MYTSFGVNDTNAVKLWSKFLAKAERDSIDIAPLMGDDDNAIIHIKEETEKGSGDKVTFSLRARPTGDGFTESETAEGNAEALSFYADAIYINELGHNMGARSENTIDAQRVPFDLRKQCKNALSDWWKDRKSVSFFNQVCGYTVQTNTKYTGMNAVTAPVGTTRQIWPSTHTTDQDVTSSDGFTVGLLDRAVEAARSGVNMVRPVTIGGQPKYVVYLSEGQVVSARTNTNTGQWLDITKFTYSGVDVAKNPIYSGALGEYNGCILRRSQDVTRGVHSTSGAADADTRRAVLLGAQAACAAYGMKNYGGGKYRWNEELMDHKRKLEVSAWSIWGMKKAVFNSTDHGVVVISTYSLT
jgi:N4-gp56 family major capsid protein